jgi:Rha family phage regulatory protein
MTTQNIPEIAIINNQPTVTSRQIAEDFSKAHKNVIQDIEHSQVSDNFRKLNFQLSEYCIEGQSRKYKQYLLTRDGFTMIAMGYKGKKAIQFKENYITAFNQMAEALAQPKEEKPQISAEQLIKVRETMANCCTRYLNHHGLSMGHTLYRQMKAIYNYDKIENMLAEDFISATEWIQNHQSICHELYDMTSYLEKAFIKQIKQGNYDNMDDIPNNVLSTCQAPLLETAA